MPADIHLFQEQFSGIMLEPQTAHQQELLQWVRRGEVELALTYDMQVEDGLRFTQFGKSHLPPYAILVPESPWGAARHSFTA